MDSNVFRQGDVLLVPVTTVPADAKTVEPGVRGHVLMEGEATGHAHTIAPADGITLVTREQADELRMWLTIETAGPAPLVHDEHATIAVPPGAYEVIRQVEYTPEQLNPVHD
jgi:hypothetical protein